MPTTSGSLVTASTTASARTALSEEYDVRRQAASTVRVNARTPSAPPPTGAGAGELGGLAGSGAGPPRSRHCANSATTSSSDGTGGWSGTSEESADRISIRCSGEARVFLVGDHQQTTWDWARVRATYSRRSHSPASSSWARRTWSAQPAPPAADVAAAPAVVVVEPRQVGLADVTVGDGGQVDDGVLEALAGVDRHQLDGGGVAVETAGALQPAAGAALGDLLAQPGQQRDQAVPLGERGLVQGLADVPQVGQPPLAADLGQHPRGQPADGRGLHHRGQAAAGEQLQPRPQRRRPPRR